MAGNILDVLTAAWINVVTSIILLLAFALLKNQPMNARVYFPKWFLKGQKQRAGPAGGFGTRDCSTSRIGRFLNLNAKSYAHVMDWIWTTLRMPEAELIEHAGLDSAALLRVFLLGLKIFSPMLAWGCLVLIPINKTDNELISYKAGNPNFIYSAVDTISIANVHDKSKRNGCCLRMNYVLFI